MPRSIDLLINHADEHQLLSLIGTSVHQPPCPVAEGCWDVQLADGLTARLGRRVRDHFDFAYGLRVEVADTGASAVLAVRILADDLQAAGVHVLVVHDLHNRAAPAPEPA